MLSSPLSRARFVWICGCSLALACSDEQAAPIDAGGGATSGAAGVGGTPATGGGGASAGSNAGNTSTTGGSGGTPSAGAAPGGSTSSGSGGAGSPSTGGAAGQGGSVAGQGGAAAGSGGQAGTAGSGGSSGSPAYSPCPTTANTPCAVLPLGDSITEGYGSSGGGYRVEIFRQALQHDKGLTFVGTLQNGPNNVDGQPFPKRHQGHGGYTIDSGGNHNGISGSITQTALDMFHPHIVLLMIGTNDINGNIDVANAPTRLGKLIDDITTRSPTTLVVVATIIPIANDGTNQKVKTYNAALPGVVSARANAGKHVVLLDNYAAFSKDASYATKLMGDYLHPNDAGYAVLGRSFYDLIAPSLLTK